MARRRTKKGSPTPGIESLIEEVLLDAYGEEEQLWAFRQAFEDHVPFPADAYVIGEPVSVLEVDYDGNALRGLTAVCKKEDGETYTVSMSDVVFPEVAEGIRYLEAYRFWLGLEPTPPAHRGRPQKLKRHKAEGKDIAVGGAGDLIVLSVKERAARCRIPGTERLITLRSGRLWDVAPGEIVTVQPRKRWRYAGHPYLSGEIKARRIDVPALELSPLGLESEGVWNPADEYWGEGDAPPEWAVPIIERGPRPSFGMEQVLPGWDWEDPFGDPITEATDARDAGELDEARRILMELAEADLRCLDAHSHLGNLVFDRWPEHALRHYEIGKRIGELSLGDDFDGVLLWGLIDNRPYLRCLHGYGLCLWRLERFTEAEQVFESMIWLNPTDNQGVRFILPAIRAREGWEDDGEE